MGKLLFWIIVIIGGLLAARLIAHNQARRAMEAKRPRAPLAKSDTSEAMVRCAHCGIHLPRSEAVLMNGQTWCSQEHARLGVRQ
ncbi:PP0621 family protein [Allopusillimonas soli]|uniref:MYND finger n=1 Tax=Allopusillimonas soli TaxID=659016 RepID=A0A853F752_9BURK|nr:PP0621 family protein [Allopusillimonas soli]NYT35799.1 hypothetical protein [Allopusillimonas soli]